jgi:hypothetical protein
MKTVFFLLACYGLTFLICDSSILSRPREVIKRLKLVNELLSCYFCAGFWVGLFWFFALYWAPTESVSYRIVFESLAYALAGAAFSFSFDILVETVEHITYGIQVYTGKFEAILAHVREQERAQGIDPDAPEEDDDDGE